MPSLMKGHTWNDHGHKMTYPCIAEIKYDEIRCHVIVEDDLEGAPPFKRVRFLSYAGKPLANMHGFGSKFIELHRLTGWREFDCGFEVNGNFNDSYRWVRSTKALPEDLHDVPVRFVLFDLPESDSSAEPRRKLRDEVHACWHDWIGDGLDLPEFRECSSEHGVLAYFAEATERGFEGLMVKSLEHKYQRGKRIYGWLKLKPEEDGDGEIIELHEAICGKDQPELGLHVGDHLGRIGSVSLRLEDGSIATPHGIPHDLGREMFLNPQAYLGQWAEFKYMQRDRQGGYRHPTWGRLREAKQ